MAEGGSMVRKVKKLIGKPAGKTGGLFSGGRYRARTYDLTDVNRVL
jgi:hypothetical protein